MSLVHISYILLDRNSKFGVLVHLRMAECHISFGVTVTLTLISGIDLRIIVSGAHLFTYYEVGILNLVCGCILGWQSIAYHFRVTVTLTSDLAFRIIVSGAYMLYYLR